MLNNPNGTRGAGKAWTVAWLLAAGSALLGVPRVSPGQSVEDKDAKVKLLTEVIAAAVEYGECKAWAPPVKVEVVPVTGTVFVDADGNGRRDAGELPIENVRISDGYTVVLTDSAGRYTLYAPKEYVNVRITIPGKYWPTEVMRGWYRGMDLSAMWRILLRLNIC